MSDRASPPTATSARLSVARPAAVLVAAAFCFPGGALGDDSYLDAIQVEAQKLDESAAQPSQPDAGDADASPQGAFEQELETRYRGSYLFYKKLPAKSQEEVFLEYSGGASIDEVRKTIMNRFLHSR